ncbi:hypothetical protein GIB67_002847 [Kingdonia uniflora]|uniref:Uncharacterized protein n=1 Tax=Kingdonia uniflora TaxID=39325 RepID=A0A7J7M5B8_9MAGN|nr:hypothetical protein GIB67_002847 [Kingdonia uniflora]
MAAEESPRSPEAKLGLRVEDLWDIQQPQLSPSEKLNSCFENILVSSFPPSSSSQGQLFSNLAFINLIEINSDSSLDEAVQILSKQRVLSALVRDVEAPEDASWIDRYIGIVEFAGIVVWLLHQSEVTAVRIMGGSAAALEPAASSMGEAFSRP